MSIHGMIDERLRQALADALAPLIVRLEALEQQLQTTELVAGVLRTTEPGQPLPPVVHGEAAAEPEDLPGTADPEPSPAPRRRAPRK